MSKIVSFVNLKGGVGKTTVAVSMAEASAAAGKRVLFIDLDIQINASMAIVGNCPDPLLPWRRSATIENVLEHFWSGERASIRNFVMRFGTVHLLSGSPSVTLFERRLLNTESTYFGARLTADRWVQEIFQQALQTYDLIICDTPPGLSLLAESAIRRSDLIVIPQVPDRLSTQGLQLYAHYITHDLQIGDIAKRTAVFINKRGQNRVAEDYEKKIRADAGNPRFPYKMFRNCYRNSVVFKRAMDRSMVDQPNRVRFEHLWDIFAADVKAATRELWEFLGWINDDERSVPSDSHPRPDGSLGLI